MPARYNRNPYEPDEAEELSFYYAQARKVNGATPPEHPNRRAGDYFAGIVADRRDSVDPPYTYYELATPIVVDGKPLDQRTLRMFLGRRGYERLPPSQKAYRGVSIYSRHRTETHFACGHERVKENSYVTKRGLDICRTCQMEANRAYHQARRAEARENGEQRDANSTFPDDQGNNTPEGQEEAEMPRAIADVAADINAVLEQGDIADLLLEPQEDNATSQAAEGRLRLVLKSLRQRNRKLREEKLTAVALSGRPLACEICEFDFGEVYGPRGAGYIEVHHATPLHVTGPVTTSLADLVLLCANCHRMIHRGPNWLTVSELRAQVKAEGHA